MKFSKDKMINRLTQEGKADMIDDEIMAIMDSLDGQETLPAAATWSNRVKGEPVLGAYSKNGEFFEVNIADCE